MGTTSPAPMPSSVQDQLETRIVGSTLTPEEKAQVPIASAAIASLKADTSQGLSPMESFQKSIQQKQEQLAEEKKKLLAADSGGGMSRSQMVAMGLLALAPFLGKIFGGNRGGQMAAEGAVNTGVAVEKINQDDRQASRKLQEKKVEQNEAESAALDKTQVGLQKDLAVEDVKNKNKIDNKLKYGIGGGASTTINMPKMVDGEVMKAYGPAQEKAEESYQQRKFAADETNKAIDAYEKEHPGAIADEGTIGAVVRNFTGEILPNGAEGKIRRAALNGALQKIRADFGARSNEKLQELERIVEGSEGNVTLKTLRDINNLGVEAGAYRLNSIKGGIREKIQTGDLAGKDVPEKYTWTPQAKAPAGLPPMPTREGKSATQYLNEVNARNAALTRFIGGN